MLSFAALKDGYEQNWANLQIRPSAKNAANKAANRLLSGKDIYKQVEARTNVKWFFVGLCHSRESDFNFNTYLGNGQPLGQVTTIVPKGRGPFTGPNAFIDGCVDALRLEGFVGATDWGIARTLFRLEGFNGFGYHKFGVNSPYLYGGSTIYGPPEAKGGKFVRDGVFDPNTVDTQLGAAVILKALVALDPSITFDVTSPPVSLEPDDEQAKNVVLVQHALNKLGIVSPPLAEDGINGPKTKSAISLFQQQSGLPDTGLPDAATIAAVTAKAAQPIPVPVQPPGPIAQPTDPAQILQQLQKILQGQQLPIPIPGATDLPTVLQQLQNLLTALQSSGVVPKGAAIPAPADLSGILQQLQNLVKTFQPGGTTASDPITLITQLLSVLPKGTVPAAGTQATATGQPSVDQTKQVLDLLTTVLNKAGVPALGQVNGALGETIGNLLNGKKSAVGIGGSLLTALLTTVPTDPGLVAQSGALVKLLAPIVGAVPGLGQVALPIFLAMTAWGVLGKIEKWAQGTAPPPKPQT
jgi:lysozyme family protein/peptidoglycan hydrolase-like protein with peptidoglycan-binding domain